MPRKIREFKAQIAREEFIYPKEVKGVMNVGNIL